MTIPLLIIIAKPPILCHSVAGRWFYGCDASLPPGILGAMPHFGCGQSLGCRLLREARFRANVQRSLRRSLSLRPPPSLAFALAARRQMLPAAVPRPRSQSFATCQLPATNRRPPPAATCRPRSQPPATNCLPPHPPPAATRLPPAARRLPQPPAVLRSARSRCARIARKRLFIGGCPPVAGADVALLLIFDSVLYNGCRPIGVLVA